MVLVSEENAYLLACDDGKSVSVVEIASLQPDQEETDTRVILYCNYALDHGYDHIKMRSPVVTYFSPCCTMH